jgi:hypothetical protein
MLALAYTAFAAIFAAFTLHVYPLLLERGYAPAAAVGAIACIGPAQVAGRVAIWMFARRLSVRLIGSVTVLSIPVALLALAIPDSGLPVVIGAAVVYGAGNGIMTIVRGLSVPEMLTPHAYGAIYGALSTPGTFISALAPWAAALLWSGGGSYDAVLWGLITCSALMVAGFWAAALCSRSPTRQS